MIDHKARMTDLSQESISGLFFYEVLMGKQEVLKDVQLILTHVNRAIKRADKVSKSICIPECEELLSLRRQLESLIEISKEMQND